ncbi:MAG: hypothetical protein CL517_03840 [Actinobacteria bacterium]|nr:hypothetical protein [Actinomycetota bacterium]MEC7810301.1 AAA family ATPase [Actinomycetota bacterium]MED5277439.1 AAA family ATPase [Actinomycetota bacterium]
MVSIAIVNQKGGVGKTSVTLGLASSAARRGLETLIVDLDPQGNATTGLGVFEPLKGVINVLEEETVGGISEVSEKAKWPSSCGQIPYVAASTPNLSVCEPRLATDPLGAQNRLSLSFESANWPLVIVDCPPSLGLLTINALFAVDLTLVVTEPGAWSVDGVARMIQTIEKVKTRRVDSKPEIAGIAVNRLGRTRDDSYWNAKLEEAYSSYQLPKVHLRTAVAEASAQSLPIHGLGNRSGAAEAAAEFDQLLTLLLEDEYSESNSDEEEHSDGYL